MERAMREMMEKGVIEKVEQKEVKREVKEERKVIRFNVTEALKNRSGEGTGSIVMSKAKNRAQSEVGAIKEAKKWRFGWDWREG